MAVLFKIPKEMDEIDLPIDIRIGLVSNYGKPQEEFLVECIKEYRESEVYKTMEVGKNYFFNKNDIIHRERYYIDRRGEPVKTELLSNNKLAHPFMRKLVNQKINYLLSKDFTIRGDENYIKELNKYFDDKFRMTLINVGKECIRCGIAWMQVYYNDKGELKFKYIPSSEIIPFWHDSQHTELDAVIRIYEVDEYQVDKIEKRIYEMIEYYTPEGVWKYKRLKAGGSLINLTETEGEGHFKVIKDGDKEYDATWNRVPFVAFKYNMEEVSLINWIKPLIDDYDKQTSDNSNNLADVPNSIKIVEGYEDNDKEEFSKNLNIFRTVFVGEGGDVRSLNTDLDLAGADIHLKRLRKDIFEFGGGVDTVEKDLRDVAGVALRFQYADLDMDCSEMAQQFRYSMRELQWFINEDLKSNNKTINDEGSDFIFNTDVIINETETINNLAITKDIISQKTLLQNHPWVKNVDEEIKDIKTDKEEQLKYDIRLEEATVRINNKYKTNSTSNSTYTSTYTNNQGGY